MSHFFILFFPSSCNSAVWHVILSRQPQPSSFSWPSSRRSTSPCQCNPLYCRSGDGEEGDIDEWCFLTESCTSLQCIYQCVHHWSWYGWTMTAFADMISSLSHHPIIEILSFSALVLSLVLESSMVAPRHRSQTRLGQTDLVPTMSLVVVSFLSPLKQVTIVTQFQKFQWISSSGFVLEALLTMLLVLVVYATAVDNKVTITMSKIKTLLSL